MELDGLPLMVMFPPAVTLNFDLLIPKSHQHIYEPNFPKYICGQNLAKFLHILCTVFTMFSHRLTHRRTHAKT